MKRTVADLGGGALGASAPPAESMEKNLNLPVFFSMYGRSLFACSVSPKVSTLEIKTAVNCHT